MVEGHWCAEHETVYFKKGAMKGYAHPIGETGKWCNEGKTAEKGREIQTAKANAAAPTPSESPVKSEVKEPTSEMTKEDWAEKNKMTRKSIERQKALELAVTFAIAKGKGDSKDVLIVARLFEAYLDGMVDNPRSSRLVDEARKLGEEPKG